MTLLTYPGNYRLGNKLAYASASTSLASTYKVKFLTQEIEGRVVTPMPKDIAEEFKILYITIRDIKKWSNKEYKLPKEYNKYFLKEADKEAERTEESKTSLASEELNCLVGT